jgi:hypothetical protein
VNNSLDKIVHYFGEFLDGYYILNISLQSFIKLGYFSTLVLSYSKYVLYEACEVFGDGVLLFRRYKLEFYRPCFVEVLIRFVEEGNIFFYVF